MTKFLPLVIQTIFPPPPLTWERVVIFLPTSGAQEAALQTKREVALSQGILVTTIDSTSFHAKKETGPERGRACQRPQSRQGSQATAGIFALLMSTLKPITVGWEAGDFFSGASSRAAGWDRGLGRLRDMEEAHRIGPRMGPNLTHLACEMGMQRPPCPPHRLQSTHDSAAWLSTG